MVKVKDAKKGDLAALDGELNVLGGPSFSYSAPEMFMMAPYFAVLAAGSRVVALDDDDGGAGGPVLVAAGAQLGHHVDGGADRHGVRGAAAGCGQRALLSLRRCGPGRWCCLLKPPNRRRSRLRNRGWRWQHPLPRR